MNRVLRNLVILTAGMFVAWCSAQALADAQQQAPAKPTVGLVVKVMTRTEGVDFSAYTRQAVSTIRHNWSAAMPEEVKAGEKGLVVVRVQIQRDGTFVNQTPQIERSSNRQALDDAAVAALRASAPFPHLPDDFHGSRIELRITFLYNIPLRTRDAEPAKASAEAASPK